MIAAQIHFLDIIHLFKLTQLCNCVITLHKEVHILVPFLQSFVQDVDPNLHSKLYRQLVSEFCPLKA